MTTTPKSTTLTTYVNVNEFLSYCDFISYLEQLSNENIFIKSNKKIEYANVPCVIDLETTSFYDENKNKCACMYCGTIGVNGRSYLFRTYTELMTILTTIQNIYGLCKDRRMIFYIHNLSFDFQFLIKHFFNEEEPIKVFSLAKREPVKAIINSLGIELRCSFKLSGYSLEKVGEHLQKYKVKKLKGDLDYKLLRHSGTPLTKKERGYVLNDGLVVMSYIQEQIESHNNNISNIPLTKTGEVRILTRKNCLYGGKKSHKRTGKSFYNYRLLMRGLSIKSVDEYLQLRNRVFCGGFTHANAFYNNVVVNDVWSFDFTSSYPYVLVSEKYPVGTAKLITIENTKQFKYYLKNYCCMFDVKFINLREKLTFEHPISVSHCRNRQNVREDNGRVVSADVIETSLTETDFDIIQRFYKWDKMFIKQFRRYRKEYLPTPFVKTILELYTVKTTLKNVVGMECEYQHGKENLNSLYGMCVTDICRPEIEFNDQTGEWSVQELTNDDLVKMLCKYNNKPNRVIAYQWGVWCTSYARRNLFTGIYHAKMNYIYSDTDSIKVRLNKEIEQYIEQYNKNVITKLENAMKYHNLPIELCSPKTIDGKIKTLGLWDREYHAKRFKTLGSKRYMVEYDNEEISLTVSGVNKNFAIPYLKTLGKDLFDLFDETLYIPKEYTVDNKTYRGTGKTIHTYIDEPQSGYLVDYLGNRGRYDELSSVHMEESDYTLSISDIYLQYLLSIRRKEYN